MDANGIDLQVLRQWRGREGPGGSRGDNTATAEANDGCRGGARVPGRFDVSPPLQTGGPRPRRELERRRAGNRPDGAMVNSTWDRTAPSSDDARSSDCSSVRELDVPCTASRGRVRQALLRALCTTGLQPAWRAAWPTGLGLAREAGLHVLAHDRPGVLTAIPAAGCSRALG